MFRCCSGCMREANCVRKPRGICKIERNCVDGGYIRKSVADAKISSIFEENDSGSMTYNRAAKRNVCCTFP